MKKVSFKKVLKIFKSFLIILLLLVLLVTTIPYVKPQGVSNEYKELWEAEKNKVAEKPKNIDRARLVEHTTDSFNARYALITNSQSTLDLAFHIIQDGDSTNILLSEIYKAAERGVKVRIMLDAKVMIAATQANKKLKAIAAHPNITIKRYNPISFFRLPSAHILLHDKFIISDSTYLLLGGRNIGEKYHPPKGYTDKISDDRDVLIWNEKNDAVNSVLVDAVAYMDELWNHEHTVTSNEKENLPLLEEMLSTLEPFKAENPDFFALTLADYENKTVPTNHVSLVCNSTKTGPKEPRVAYSLYDMAKESEGPILIQTPYSTGNKIFLNILSELSEDKDIIMLTNSMGSSPNFPAFSNYYSQRKKFLKAGAQIFEYQNSNSIHGKSIIFGDNISAVGSFNMDDRSYYLSTESMLIIDSPEFTATLKEAVGDYMSLTLEVGEDNKYIENENVVEAKASPFKVGLMWFVSLFSRLFEFLI